MAVGTAGISGSCKGRGLGRMQLKAYDADKVKVMYLGMISSRYSVSMISVTWGRLKYRYDMKKIKCTCDFAQS